ncbi:MAG TPA: hypothetical protein PKA37_01065 [Planctomycetota bacterium]|nr:hypothetical protein [Planctomycetota bacterium]
MTPVRFIFVLTVLQMALSAQVQILVPNPTPSAGASGAPFDSGAITYVLILRAQDLDPANRRITDLSFLPVSTSVWTSGTLQFGMGHIGTLPGPSAFSLPLITGGAVTSVGSLLDFTPLYDASVDGPFSYTWTANEFSPMNLPAQGGRSFVWDGIHSIAVYFTWQSAQNVPAASGWFASGDSTMVRYQASSFQASLPTQWASFGLAARLDAQPASPTVISVGSGCSGAGGFAPILHTGSELPVVPNPSFAIRLSQAAPGTAAFLYGAFGMAETPLSLGGGCSIFLDMESLLLLVNAGISPLGPVATTIQGDALWPMPVPVDPGLVGLRVALQAAVQDSAAPLGWTLSNALDVFFN